MSASDCHKYYSRGYRPLAPVAMAMGALFLRSRLRKRSLVNRQKDYIALSAQPGLFQLHQRMNALLAEGERSWGSYDYGEGYFYQSYSAICVTGLRDTERRIEAMELMRRVSGQRILEVGSNAGFLSIQIAAAAESVDGCEIAPHLVRIARDVAEYQKKSNCAFHLSPFERFPEQRRYGVLLSFANHSTLDGNTVHSFQEYLAKCRRLTAPGGRFLFESHPPQHEPRSHDDILDCMRRHFAVESSTVLEYGTVLDRHRLFVVARCTD